jgi:serine/threonine protein kinase
MVWSQEEALRKGFSMNKVWMGGRYQSVQLLSRNGFSQTHLIKGRERVGDGYCVLKHMQVAQQPAALQRLARSIFNQEVTVLRTLQGNDRFPMLLQTEETAEALTLVHSWIPGVTLQDEFATTRLWSQSEVIEFLKQALQVLVILHGCGFLHGDLKPAHWIRRYPDQQLCLIDFGAARRLDAVDGMPSIFSEFSLGTLGYIAPEQAQGRPRWSSDLYGLGMIVLQGVTGLPPSHLSQNRQGEWQWSAPEGFSTALIDILTRLVRYRWQDRYSTAAEVLADLKPLIQAPRWQKIRRWFSPPTPSRSLASHFQPRLPEVPADQNAATVLIHGVGELPDTLVQSLTTAITAQGGRVLVINPLEKQNQSQSLQEVDLNIVLLSQDVDAQSWLFYTLQHNQGLGHSGLPKLIPVHYPVPNTLTEEWGEALQGVRQYLWRSQEDSPAIVEVVTQSIHRLNKEVQTLSSVA